MIKRALSLEDLIQAGKVVILYGPRQVGKTTLVKSLLDQTSLKYRYDTGDNFQIAQALSACTYQSTDDHVSNYDLIVIDEAQKIPNIGNALKLMVDRHPTKYFIATGSSSFELAQKTGESLTGRKRLATLYPLSQYELVRELALSELQANLPQYLVYGSYPEVITAPNATNRVEIIQTLTYSYLIKDILEFDRIKSAEPLYHLLKLLAYQVDSQVSTVELGTQLGLDGKTVRYYLDLLEKSFVIFPLSGFSRNLRKEVTKMSKYYFFDNGIRNALINNFNGLEDRNDVGALWENYLMIERRKRNHYTHSYTNSYFWRTYEQKKLDLVEENGGKLFGYEYKWGKNAATSSERAWLDAYPEATFERIDRGNYLDFLT